MKRVSRGVFLAGASAALANVTLARASQSFRDLRKAVWAWHTEPGAWPGLESFCQVQRVEHIMLALPQDTRSSLLGGDTSIVGELKSLKTNGRALWALMGEQDWVTSKKSLPESLSQVLQIQQRDGIFDGFEFDIEPHLLPQWRSGDRVAVAKEYLDLLSRIRAATNKLEVAVTAVPSYAEVILDDGNSLLWHVARSADRVSLMAYRDSPSAAIKYAQSSIDVFRAARCPWRFGVLVNQSAESHVSYFGTAPGEFTDDMIELDQSLRGKNASGYLGLAFEDYDGLRSLLQRST